MLHLFRPTFLKRADFTLPVILHFERFWGWSDFFFWPHWSVLSHTIRPPAGFMSDGYLSLSLWVSLSQRCSGSSCTSLDVQLSSLKWPETVCAHMAPGKVLYPSVFVVDSKMNPPPLPPKPGRRQRKEVVQTLLVILVCVAICGMAVEACFIYRLFTSKENAVSTTWSNFLKHRCLVYFHSASFFHSHYQFI